MQYLFNWWMPLKYWKEKQCGPQTPCDIQQHPCKKDNPWYYTYAKLWFTSRIIPSQSLHIVKNLSAQEIHRQTVNQIGPSDENVPFNRCSNQVTWSEWSPKTLAGTPGTLCLHTPSLTPPCTTWMSASSQSHSTPPCPTNSPITSSHQPTTPHHHLMPPTWMPYPWLFHSCHWIIPTALANLGQPPPPCALCPLAKWACHMPTHFAHITSLLLPSYWLDTVSKWHR